MDVPSEVRKYMKKVASLGGEARKKALTTKQRSRIARKAARARWKRGSTAPKGRA